MSTVVEYSSNIIKRIEEIAKERLDEFIVLVLDLFNEGVSDLQSSYTNSLSEISQLKNELFTLQLQCDQLKVNAVSKTILESEKSELVKIKNELLD